MDLLALYRDVEDHLVPGLRLGMAERAIYYHLLRHSRAEGRRQVQLSKRRLCRGVGCAFMTVHRHLAALAEKGCVRIQDRGRAGHRMEVFIPAEIAGLFPRGRAVPRAQLERIDCFRSHRMRSAILNRERHACFYCLRALSPESACFDHARPVAAGGDNSYRNVVACCFDCNSLKRDRAAPDFLRQLYRAERLSSAELDSRLAALRALRCGGLLPQCAEEPPRERQVGRRREFRRDVYYLETKRGRGRMAGREARG
jgi:hypothetical protein